jgi:hypothetical protein
VVEWWSGGDMTCFRIAFALRVGVPDGLRLSMPIVNHAYSRTHHSARRIEATPCSLGERSVFQTLPRNVLCIC